MTNESATSGRPPAVDRATFQAGRPIPQWPRLEAGHSDDLTAGH